MEINFPKYYYYIKEAINRGYGFDFKNQILIRIKSNWKPRLYGKQRYPYMEIWIDKKVQAFPLHKFCAYLLYGDKAFEKGIVVRHKDGNTLNLSKDNILLGTHSQNNMDKPKHKRIYAAKCARAAQGKSSWNQGIKMSENFRQKCREREAKKRSAKQNL